MSLILLVLGLMFFVGLVVIHEFGHFIAARRGGVEVEEFGIGFPPRAKILGKKKGTIYTLNMLPLGGFVKLKGENDSDKSKGSFGAAPLSTKVKIMTAGVIMNLIAAFVLLTITALVGMPKLIPNQFSVASDAKVVRQDVYVGLVEDGSPADTAGVEQRDRLITISSKNNYNSVVIANADSLPNITENFAGQSVNLEVERGGHRVIIENVNLRSKSETVTENEKKGILGVAPYEFTLEKFTWSAPVVAGGLIAQFTKETIKGIGSALNSLVHGKGSEASKNVAGPVGVFVLLRDGSLVGFEFVLAIIAIISLTLAIMNILPIPALDGGRLFVTLLFRALRKPLTKDTENLIHGAGFAVLMLLFVLITVVDIRRFF